MSKIKNSAVIGYVAIFAEIILGLIYTPWMLSVIGEDNYALYSLAISLMAFLMLDFGLSNSVTRFLSNYRAEGNQDKANNFLGLVFKLYLLIDAIFCLALIIIYFNLHSIYTGLDAEHLSTFRGVFLMMGLFSMISFPCIPISGIMRAYENFVELKTCELLNKLLAIGTIAFLLWRGSVYEVSREFLLYGLVAANCLWNLVFILIKLIIIKKKDPITIEWKYFDKTHFKEVFSFSIWITIIQFFERFFVLFTPTLLAIVIIPKAAAIQSDLLNLGDNSSTIQIAIFGLAIQIETYTFTFVNTINGLFMPKVSRMVYANDEKGIEDLMVLVGKFQCAIIGLVLCGFWVVGIPFVDYWAKASSYPYLVWVCSLILLLPMLFTRTQLIAGVVAEVRNEMKSQAKVYALTSVLYIAVAAMGSYFWGALGACIALSSVSVARMAFIDIIYYKRLNLNIALFFKKCYGPLFLTVAITLMVCTCLRYVDLFNPLMDILIKVGAVSVVYIVTLRYVGMKKSEIRQLLGK